MKKKSSPYNKNVKPDYPDIDGDGNRKESMKKAAADKKSPMNMKKKSPMDMKKSPMDMKKKKEAGKFQSKEEAVNNIKSFGKGKGRGRTGAILSDSPMNMKRKSESPMAKYKSDAQRKAVHASKNEKSPMNMMGKGPRYEGKRGKGTGYAN